MPITTLHPEYEAHIGTWEKIDKVLDRHVDWCIPDIEPIYEPNSPAYCPIRNMLARRSCKMYRESGIFTNFSLQTLQAIIALALNAPPTYNLPDKLQYLEKDATGNGLTLDQLIQKILSRLVSVGRCALFTDYPDVPTGLDKETQLAMNLGPHMTVFDPKCVTNWKTRYVAGQEQLYMIVIRQDVPDKLNTDKYTHKCIPAYLELEIKPGDNVYYQAVKGQDEKYIIDPFQPKKNGKVWKNIPIDFIGSENNDSSCDVAPLESIVDLNIGHYRNSCVYEDNLRRHGRGTTAITSSLPADQWQEYYKDKPIVLGTDNAYFLGESGEIKIVQLPPAQEAANAMNQKQEQLIMAGAHIVTGNPTNVSTETTRLNMSNKISMLNTIVGNAEDVLNKHIGYCAEYQGLEPQKEPYVTLSREYIKKIADPLVMAQLLSAMNGAAIPKRIYLNYLKSVNLLDANEDIEAVAVEAENENPLDGQPDLNQFNLPGK